MAKDDEHRGDGYSLEDILREFADLDRPPERESRRPQSDSEEEQPPVLQYSHTPEKEEESWKSNTIAFPGKRPPSPRKDWRGNTISFPIFPQPPSDPPAGGKKAGIVTAFPGTNALGGKASGPVRPPRSSPKAPPPPEEEEEEEELKEELEETGTILNFPPPAGTVNRVTTRLDQLRRRADEFAGHMYEEDETEEDEADDRTEEDEEKAERNGFHVPRFPTFHLPSAPDIPPSELAKRFQASLRFRKVKLELVFLLFLASLYVTIGGSALLPLPDVLVSNHVWRCWTLAGLHALGLIVAIDTVLRGIVGPLQLRAGMDTLIILANLAVLADAVTLPLLAEENITRQPYCVVSIVGLFFVMKGDLCKCRGQRAACRTAASASEPYLVKREAKAWNGRDTCVKDSGFPVGFGSQIQEPDGAERIFHIFVPLLLISCFLLAVLSSLGRKRPENFLWCLAALLTASGSLSATLCFGPPWQKLSARLSKSGAALAGWDGVASAAGPINLLLFDTDLFPPGTVEFDGIDTYGNFPANKVVSYTATVIRDAKSGLNKAFHDLLVGQGTIYRRGERLTSFEEGGFSEMIRGEEVLVGSFDFLEQMEVPLPSDLDVNSAVLCAIDGELAGVFWLKYKLSPAAPLAVDSLLRSRVALVLATRDWNVNPDMLQSHFRLPVSQMEFPSTDQCKELFNLTGKHTETLTAVLCLEGISSYAETIVGGRRLYSAVRSSTALSCVGAVLGMLLSFYLTFVAAYDALSPVNLLIFLLMWLVPTPLISGWVDRY